MQVTAASMESKLPDSGALSGTLTSGSSALLSNPLPRFINQLIDDGKGPTLSGTAQAHTVASSSSSSSSSAGAGVLHLEDSVNDLLHAKIEQRTDFLISTADTLRSVSFSFLFYYEY